MFWQTCGPSTKKLNWPTPGLASPLPDKMDPYDAIRRLIPHLIQNQDDFALYVDGINTHFGKIDEEDRIRSFSHFIRFITWHLRAQALTGSADTFLEIPTLFRTIATMSNIRNCMYFKEDVEKIMKAVKKGVAYDQEGEMAYVVEEEWLKGIFKAMRKVHEEHLAERKKRMWAIREELIATILSPERAYRMAAAHGMEAMDWLITNEGYELQSY
jgi:hypothetical protein